MSVNSMRIRDALQHANNAGRGSLSALETVIKALAEGAVYDTYAGNPTSNVTPKAKGTWILDTSNNIWYRAKALTNTDWVAIGTHGLTAAELAYLDGVTIGTGLASKALILDASGRVSIPSVLAVEAAAGITGGSGTIYASSVQRIGGIIKTEILLYLDGLSSSTTDLDIIGQSTPDAHLGQITAAVNGTILGGRMSCLEVPAGGVTDIDLYSANESTGAFDDAGASTLTETALVTAGGAWTLNESQAFGAIPPANDYLYLFGGAAGTAAEYTAGKFLIELFGYDA